MSVKLRPTRPEDDAFLFKVYSSTRKDELDHLNWDRTRKQSFLKMQFNAQHKYYRSQFPNADFNVVLHKNKPIGRLYVDRRPGEIRIVDIALLSEQESEGVGTALLRGLMEEAARDKKPIRIHVEKFSPVLELYKRLGFVDRGDTGVYFVMEWNPPAVVPSMPKNS